MLAPEFLPVWGGVGSYTVELVRHLSEEAEIHVVTPFRKSLGQYKISSHEYDLTKYFREKIYIHFLGTASDTFFYNAIFQYIVAKFVPRLVKEENIDVIHSHTAHMPDIILQFRNIKPPILTTIHTTIKGQREGTKESRMSFRDLELSEKLTFLMYPALRTVETIYFIKDRYYVTVSNWMKKKLLNYYPKLKRKKIYVIHNAVDVNLFRPSSIPLYMKKAEGKYTILFTGRMISAKGIDTLIKSIPIVLREKRDVIFLFVGPGNPYPYIKKLKSMNVPNSCYKFLGYMKYREDLAKLYAIADVYVAPTYYENLPIRVLEAMSSETPPVASNVCAIPEAIKNFYNGILISPGNHKALADAILYLLQNPEERKRMGKNARLTIEKYFNWNVATQRYIRLYRAIIDDNRS
jgi:glycosyltransferase involved in cell wall biosynthesis